MICRRGLAHVAHAGGGHEPDWLWERWTPRTSPGTAHVGIGYGR